jgi:hypothetical protein
MGLHWSHDSDPIAGIRRIGDRKTWVLKFDIKEVAFEKNVPPVPDYVVESSTFEIRVDRRSSPMDHYCMYATTRFHQAALKHVYTARPEFHYKDDNASDFSDAIRYFTRKWRVLLSYSCLYY